jgi:hypothetical protein
MPLSARSCRTRGAEERTFEPLAVASSGDFHLVEKGF